MACSGSIVSSMRSLPTIASHALNGSASVSYTHLEEEVLNTLPELAEGQSFSVMANVSEHFTSPPKAYTEDTLLSAMERAGAEDMPEDKVN